MLSLTLKTNLSIMQVIDILTIIKSAKWTSFSTEIRPSIVKSESGIIKPLYCSREFEFPSDNEFTLKFVNYADPFGTVPLVEMNMAGHIIFGKTHPIAEGAYEIDYVADKSFEITLIHEQLFTALNHTTSAELGEWIMNQPKQVLGKSVQLFGLEPGQPFKEYDLIFVNDDLLFNGARHIDGRPFDSPENRPTNLQIPLKKVSYL